MIEEDDFFKEPKGTLWGIASMGVGLIMISADIYYFVFPIGIIGPLAGAGFFLLGFGIADCVPSDRQGTIAILRASFWGFSLGIWCAWGVFVLL